MENVSSDYEQEAITTPVQAGFKTGVILGLVSLVVFYVAYFIDVSLLVNTWFSFTMFAISLGLLIYFGIDYRKSQGGLMSFGTAFQFVFIAFIISGLITTLGNILLFHVIDPALPTVLADAQLESTIAMLDRFGAGEAITGDQMAEMRSAFIESRSVIGSIKAFGISLFVYAILALILGAILKRRDKSLDY